PAAEAAPRRPLWPRVRPIARRMLPWIAPTLVALAYLAFAIHHFAAHRYQINPDGVGYISVAQKYLRGEWADAVNAYWSPLYSWLLVPLLAVGIEPLAATKVLGVGIGGLILFAMTRLLRLAGVRQDVRTIAALAAIPLVVDAAYDVITPDLLLAAALLLYLGSLC